MISRALLRRLVELACQAPSVHNTQPWIWRASGHQVGLYPDYSRQLPAEDPTGRNLVISCGAALDHFRFAARALGWDTSVSRFVGDADDRDAPLALVDISRGQPSDTAVDLDVLRTRCTDRRRFTSWPVPAPVVEALCRHRAIAGRPRRGQVSTTVPQVPARAAWHTRRMELRTWSTRSRPASNGAGSVEVAPTACR